VSVRSNWRTGQLGRPTISSQRASAKRLAQGQTVSAIRRPIEDRAGEGDRQAHALGTRSPGTRGRPPLFFFSPEIAIQSENWPGRSRSILTQSADGRIGLATRDHRGTLRDRGDRYWEPTPTPMKNQRSAPEMENEQELAHSL
jgi:hypothetical protein